MSFKRNQSHSLDTCYLKMALYVSRSTLVQNASIACLNITRGDFIAAVSTTVCLNTLVGVACIVSIALIFILKVHRIFLFRLVLYLIIITLCYMLDDALQLAAFEVVGDDGLHTRYGYVLWCIATGFFNQLFGWLALLTVCSITLHLFLLTVLKRNLHSKTREIVAIIIICLVAFSFSIPPLIPSGDNMVYGQFGINCWIRRLNDQCDNLTAGTVERILLWYIPLLCTFVFIVVTLGVTIRMLYQYRNATELNRIDQGISEVWTLFLYLLTFSVIYLIAFIPRVVDTFTTGQKSWLLDAVVQPCLMLLVPIAFIVHPATLRKLRQMCTKAKTVVVRWSNREGYEEVEGRLDGDGQVDSTISVRFEVPLEFSSESVEKLVITSAKKHGVRS